MNSDRILDLTAKHCAPNYLPLPVVISRGEGVWVEDVEGTRYLDMLSAYSALNQGHRHPQIMAAVTDQLERITLTSRAFHNDKLGPLCELVARVTGKEKALIMNSGAEAVETALKLARRWAYDVKGIAGDKAEIIVCDGNFAGRTITIISFSPEAAYKRGFGPLTPGFVTIPYGDVDALKRAVFCRTDTGRGGGGCTSGRLPEGDRCGLSRAQRAPPRRRDPDRLWENGTDVLL
jgi:ornithine--oxo-acid transaminase